MLVERFTWHVKPGCVDEFTELLDAERQRYDKATARIYTSYIGPNNTVMWEGEFEDEEERQAFWEEWLQQPEAQVLMEKMTTLERGGGSHELWNLV